MLYFVSVKIFVKRKKQYSVVEGKQISESYTNNHYADESKGVVKIIT